MIPSSCVSEYVQFEGSDGATRQFVNSLDERCTREAKDSEDRSLRCPSLSKQRMIQGEEHLNDMYTV